MAKTLFFIDPPASIHRGNNDAKLNGTATWWKAKTLDEGRGTSSTSVSLFPVTGPTNGVETVDTTANTPPHEWISEPLAADFTISGTITANLYAFENSMNDNAAINFVVEKIDGATGALTQIVKSARVTELGTTVAVQNFAVIPTSTACKRGDRLRVRVFIDDAGTMVANALAGLFHFSGPTSGATGDSWIQFTEDLTFEPVGDPSINRASQPVATGTQPFGDANSTMMTQPFVAQSALLTGITVALAKAGSPTDNVIIEIQSDSGGNPSGTVIAALGTVAGSLLTLGTTYFTFRQNIPITNGTTYHVVARRSGAQDAANFYAWWGVTGVASGWTSSKNFLSGAWNATNATATITLNYDLPSYFLTDTAETINPGSAIEKKALKTRGSGSVNAITNTAAGPTAGIQVTNIAGGTAIEWYTPPLQAFVLGGKTKFNIRGLESSAAANASLKAEIAVVSNDGSSPVVWGSTNIEGDPINGSIGELPTTDGAVEAWVAGDDTFVADGREQFNRSGGTTEFGNTGLLQYAVGHIGGALTEVRVWLSKFGLPTDNLIIEIQSDNAGNPSGTAVATIATIAGSSLTTTLTQYTYSGSWNLASGTYWIVFRRSGALDTSNDYLMGVSPSSGVAGWSARALVPGPTWNVASNIPAIRLLNAQGWRLRFRVYVDDCGNAPLVTGNTVTVSYNGTTAGVAGDSYVILPVIVTELSIDPSKSLIVAGRRNPYNQLARWYS